MIKHWRHVRISWATAMAAVIALAGCGSAGAAQRRAGTAPAGGGTAYWAEQPLSPPNYIFPLISGAYYSTENANHFQTLLYRPLYWYGDQDRPGIDYALSLGNAPVYSDADRVVTITLKRARWSNGESVSARDVLFWINLLKANRGEWASYVPGGFPDNVRSVTVLGQRTLRLTLTHSYNPSWYTNNELSQITPLPLAWDVTSLPGGKRARAVGAAGGRSASRREPRASGPLPDTTPAGARAVYSFLNGQAKRLSTYASSPIWSVVDGAWKLASLTSSGQATFVPNPSYSGPDKPRLAKFVELPFTSETAEFSVLRAGSAVGDRGGSAPQLSVGYVPDPDVPQERSLRAQGYRLSEFVPFGFDYFEPNFNNPTVGPIFKQLYFRQAFQHLVDQRSWIHSYYQGMGVPNYSPVPAQPRNPYSDALARTNPYPFSVTAARGLLEAHGWKVRPGGVTTCVRPGTRAGECGPGIAAGKQLRFSLTYPDDASYVDGAMIDLQSVARQVGIVIALKKVTVATVDAEIEPCKAGTSACDWQIGQYGGAWVFAPDHYPSGEETFQTGALGNVGSYSNPRIDALIRATETTTSPLAAQRALNAYADAVRAALPVFWQPSPGTLLSVQSNLAGVVPNAYDFLSPEEWHFTR